ncbi:uncharacterized protein LOC143293856 isoform X2 [Babylonia areolata]|uniref:uncharacterized protein LOC143293856 isoform X2 n=1 Tax=Babylonia areolata TaxID=304850 RepID=UPI003FCF48AA
MPATEIPSVKPNHPDRRPTSAEPDTIVHLFNPIIPGQNENQPYHTNTPTVVQDTMEKGTSANTMGKMLFSKTLTDPEQSHPSSRDQSSLLTVNDGTSEERKSAVEGREQGEPGQEIGDSVGCNEDKASLKDGNMSLKDLFAQLASASMQSECSDDTPEVLDISSRTSPPAENNSNDVDMTSNLFTTYTNSSAPPAEGNDNDDWMSNLFTTYISTAASPAEGNKDVDWTSNPFNIDVQSFRKDAAEGRKQDGVIHVKDLSKEAQVVLCTLRGMHGDDIAKNVDTLEMGEAVDSGNFDGIISMNELSEDEQLRLALMESLSDEYIPKILDISERREAVEGGAHGEPGQEKNDGCSEDITPLKGAVRNSETRETEYPEELEETEDEFIFQVELETQPGSCSDSDMDEADSGGREDGGCSEPADKSEGGSMNNIYLDLPEEELIKKAILLSLEQTRIAEPSSMYEAFTAPASPVWDDLMPQGPEINQDLILNSLASDSPTKPEPASEGIYESGSAKPMPNEVSDFEDQLHGFLSLTSYPTPLISPVFDEPDQSSLKESSLSPAYPLSPPVSPTVDENGRRENRENPVTRWMEENLDCNRLEANGFPVSKVDGDEKGESHSLDCGEPLTGDQEGTSQDYRLDITVQM